VHRSNRLPRSAILVAVTALLLTASACADDAIRAGADDLLRIGAQHGDEIANLLRTADEAAALGTITRVRSIADELEVPPEIREAFEGLVWDVGCEVGIRLSFQSPSEITDELISRANSWGIAFSGDGADRTANALIMAMNQEPNGAIQACQDIDELLEQF
jgi:hypothetical protein